MPAKKRSNGSTNNSNQNQNQSSTYTNQNSSKFLSGAAGKKLQKIIDEQTQEQAEKAAGTLFKLIEECNPWSKWATHNHLKWAFLKQPTYTPIAWFLTVLVWVPGLAIVIWFSVWLATNSVTVTAPTSSPLQQKVTLP